MAGYLAHGGNIHYLPNGEPAMFTEFPILTHEEWRATCRALDTRNTRSAGVIVHTDSAGELSGIGACRSCGRALYHHVQRKHLKAGRVAVYRHYRCAAGREGIHCATPAGIRAADAETFYAGVLLGEVGDVPEVIHRYEAGSDHTAQAADLSDRLTRLETDFEDGRYDEVMHASYLRSLKRLSVRLRELQAGPVKPPRTWYDMTGRTVGQAWEVMDTPQRREYLHTNSVRIVVWRTGLDETTPGIAVQLGDIRTLAESLRGLYIPLTSHPRQPIGLKNLTFPMYLRARGEGRFHAPRERLRL